MCHDFVSLNLSRSSAECCVHGTAHEQATIAATRGSTTAGFGIDRRDRGLLLVLYYVLQYGYLHVITLRYRNLRWEVALLKHKSRLWSL